MGGQSIDTSSATGRFFMTMIAGAAEMERSMLTERVTMAKAAQHAAGIYMTRLVPFGYRRERRVVNGREQSYFVPHEVDAPIVREMYRRAIDAQSQRDIARWLNELGQHNTTGQPWLQGRVGIILDNPVYIGITGGKRRSGRINPSPVPASIIEPLIDAATFDAVRAVRQIAKRIHPKSRAPRGIFASRLVCGNCGQPMWAAGQGRADSGHYYYRCRGANLNSGCEQAGVGEVSLWKQLYPALLEHNDPRLSAKRDKEAIAEESRNGRRIIEIDAALERLTAAYQHRIAASR